MAQSSIPRDDDLSSSSTDVDETCASDIRAPGTQFPRDPDALPEGGYGWVCVACSFLINAHTWGINSAYGVILAFYLSDHTFPNTTALDYAFVGGLSIACAMLVSPLATYLVHHYGVRVTVITGTVLEATSLITTSFVQRNWQLFLSQGICFGVGMGFCFIGSVGVSSHWFAKRRSLVNGISAAGSGIGGLMYSLATGAMIPHLGFPWAMRILGIICLGVNLCCGCLLRLPPKAAPPPKGGAMRFSVVRNMQYAILLLWGILSVIGYVVLLFSLSSYSVAIGLTQHQGSIVGALLNLGQAFGRPAVGMLSDKLGRINVAFGATALSGLISFVFWTFAKSMVAICFFAIMVGMVAGTIWGTAAPLSAEVVGLGNMSSALGFFWLALGPPCAVAEAIAVQLRDDVTDRYPYLRVQMLVGAMYASAALCLALLKGVHFTSWK
ncbi:major facilitator superfamily domain-containing protein [Dactylonectria macrodidyma]|uniref:Major facilitator superfamily domain-containing protein n=1 Tax=Dactylonectria macrodidyma TaxID=307937 RepID=A0A9P9IH05_9HYPO|nr:major facilitator superfamily domain-containing protein [Dactylonectria macrodidyma]